MADQQPHSNVVRWIDYKATFPFVQLFRGFRLAIDPSKIALALSLLLLLYIGGRLLDERNARMVERMAPRLTEGDAFIAVGALHLPGERGILNLLAERGYRIFRVY